MTCEPSLRPCDSLSSYRVVRTWEEDFLSGRLNHGLVVEVAVLSAVARGCLDWLMVAVLFAPHTGAEWAESPPLQLGAIHTSVRDVLLRVFIVVAVVVIARVLRLRWCLLCGVGLPRRVFLGRRFVVVRGRGRASGCGGCLRRGLVGRLGLGDRAGLGICVIISAGSQRADDCHRGCYSHDFPTNDVGVFAGARCGDR